MRGGSRMIVGVAGDSAAGKNTFVRGLTAIWGEEMVTTISLDDYHTLDRAQRKKAGVTPLHPSANDLALIAEHANLLKAGQTIVKPVYDHSTGTFAPPVRLEPRPLVVLTGLLPFYTPELREVFDLKIFLDPHPDLKWRWKMKRDVAQRGYTLAELTAEMEARQRDFAKFVAPQKAHADLLIRSFSAAPREGSTPLIRSLLLRRSHPVRTPLLDLTSLPGPHMGLEILHEADPELFEVDVEVGGERCLAWAERILRAVSSFDHRPFPFGSGPLTGLTFCQLFASGEIIELMNSWQVLGALNHLRTTRAPRSPRSRTDSVQAAPLSP